MAKLDTFRDLDCWKNARKLAVAIFTIDALPLNKDWATRDQLRRAGLSIMNNIAEAFSRFSDKEQVRFYEIAQSSAAEVDSMLYLLEDIAYLNQEQTETLRQQVLVTRHQTLGLIRYLNRKNV